MGLLRLLTCVFLLFPAGLRAEPPAPAAYEGRSVKAELVERFTRFIDWPPDRPGPDASFGICVLGDDAMLPYLEHMVGKRHIKERVTVVRRLEDAEGASSCAVLWIGAAWSQHLESVLWVTSGRPILTVADTADFGQRGVILNLRPEGERLGFEINLHEARRSGLHFSSKLLRLGKIVGRDVEAIP
jgi:hypothetical protein